MGRRKKTPKPVSVVVIQDKSGSMGVRQEATISGYNEYIDNLRQDPEANYRISLTQFDHGVVDVYNGGMSLAEVPRLDSHSYVIGGSTALFDAVGKTIRKIEKTASKDDRVLVIIMTDGEENSSIEYKRNAILDLLKRKRKDGWDFVFLGAGEDSWSAGQSLGFTKENSVFYNDTPHAHSGSYSMLSGTTSKYRMGEGVSESFSSGKIGETKEELETEAGVPIEKEWNKLWSPEVSVKEEKVIKVTKKK